MALNDRREQVVSFLKDQYAEQFQAGTTGAPTEVVIGEADRDGMSRDVKNFLRNGDRVIITGPGAIRVVRSALNESSGEREKSGFEVLDDRIWREVTWASRAMIGE